ncbi:hypothetical protein V8G54_026800, partial [Vigna mungo]
MIGVKAACVMMEGRLSGVRKGAWSQTEDELLRECVQLYGKGKWHLVPQRAGLNRCRKSCRLRWLNYFETKYQQQSNESFVGRKWSLIAGRLLGRTSNDVKNYWNTNKHHKVQSHNRDEENNNNVKESERTKPHQVIKPMLGAFAKSSAMVHGKLMRGGRGYVR